MDTENTQRGFITNILLFSKESDMFVCLLDLLIMNIIMPCSDVVLESLLFIGS